jgi:hypothetical protein
VEGQKRFTENLKYVVYVSGHWQTKEKYQELKKPVGKTANKKQDKIL